MSNKLSRVTLYRNSCNFTGSYVASLYAPLERKVSAGQREQKSLQR